MTQLTLDTIDYPILAQMILIDSELYDITQLPINSKDEAIRILDVCEYYYVSLIINNMVYKISINGSRSISLAKTMTVKEFLEG